jgi:2-polyprenyl-6-methoxyphenol hydroxylase-like FAD-dependent oxidoreductase
MRYLGIEWSQSTTGRSVVSFLDSAGAVATFVARLVVGADGAHSDVRKTVCQRACILSLSLS